jgi:hypothetical protein
MSLHYITIDKIDEKALNALVESGATESKVLEFKQDLQVATDEQKQEFLSDVTAMANSDGGDLVFGMRAEKGVAKELVGLRNFVADDRIGMLENLLRDFVQPRLMGLKLEVRALSNENHALLVRVPRSFASPHMVRHKGVTRFCGRNSAGKYDLDVQELRSVFLASETMSDKLRNFRLDRINKLVSGRGPVTLTSPHLMVLHVLPVMSTRSDLRLVTADFERVKDHAPLRPIGSQGWSWSHNMDGLLVTSPWRESACHSYVQVYRNGFLEAVESQTLAFKDQEAQIIPSIAWEKRILESFPGYLKALEVLNLAPPYVVSLSLLNVEGFTMYVGPRYGESGTPIDREHLLTDDILVENPDQPPGRLLRPLFDQIWNGCGWPKSINYSEEGDWEQHR